jgi:hypothetical protein
VDRPHVVGGRLDRHAALRVASCRRRDGGDDLGLGSSWTLTALPLFIWMGEILFRTRLSQDMFRGWPRG